MRNILKDIQLRRLKLAEMLYDNQGKWGDINEYASLLDTTTYNLKNDILELEKFQVNIETHNDQIRLNLMDNPSIEHVYHQFIENSPALNIVEEVFHNPHHTNDSLADSLFVSFSTIYRYMKTLNTSLACAFQISIKRSPFRFQGSEENIRYFLGEFFIEKYSPGNWPFKVVDERSLEKFIKYFADKMNIDLGFSNLYSSKVILAVNLTRTLQGFYIPEISHDLESTYDVLKARDDFKEIAQMFENKFQVTLDLPMLCQLFYNYISDDFFFTNEDLFFKSFNDLNIKKSIDFLDISLSELSKDFNLELSNKADLILELHNSNTRARWDLNVMPILYDQRGGFIEEMKELHPEFFDAVYNSLIKYKRVMHASENKYVLNHLIYTLFSQWENLLPQLLRQKKNVNILVASKYDMGHARYLKEMIELLMTDCLNIDIYDKDYFSRSWVEASDYDIIVTNFDIDPIENKHIIYVAHSITPSIYRILCNIITEVWEERQEEKQLNPSYRMDESEKDSSIDKSDTSESSENISEAK